MRNDYVKVEIFAKITTPIVKGVTNTMKKTNSIYKLIFKYHVNMIEVCNIRYSLGLMSDDKAERTNQKHSMGAIKAAYFGGFASDEAREFFEKV